ASMPKVGPRRPESGARCAVRSSARDLSVALRGADGSALGVVTLTELMGRVATGRVPLDAWASVSGGSWTPLDRLEGVAALCARGAYHFGLGGVPGRHAMASDRRELPSYLYRVVNQRLTGVFVVRNGERARRVFFHE